MATYFFNIWTIFFGNVHWGILAEIVFRITFMYFYTFLNFRFILKKHNLNQMNAFQFIVVIALGSAVGDPMFYQKVPLIHCMLTITLIILLEKCISILSQKSSTVDKIFEGKPQFIIINGHIQFHALKKQELSIDNLMSRLRSQGVEFIEHVKYAVIEPSGELSIIKNKQTVSSGISTVAHIK